MDISSLSLAIITLETVFIIQYWRGSKYPSFNYLTLRKIIRKSRVKNSSSNREVMDTSLISNSCNILSRIRKKEKTSSWRRYDRCHHPVHPPFFFTSPPPAYHTRKDEDSPFYSYSESSTPSLTAAIQHDSSLDAFPTRVFPEIARRSPTSAPLLRFPLFVCFG